MSERSDWDEVYKKEETPWDTGSPSSELIKVLDSGVIAPCRALDLGCGTGTNAIYLAQKGFDVTAVDISEVAVKKARVKAKAANVKATFMRAKLPSARILSGEIFDFIFDRGFFHFFDSKDRPHIVDMLARLTRKGSIYLLLCGNAREPREDGPPTLTEEEIRETFSRLFDFIWIREFRFHTTDAGQGPLGYSCLLRRKKDENKPSAAS